MDDAPRIDFWDTVGRSLRIAWRHKFLWVFGFFASVSGGNLLSWVQEGSPSFRGGLMGRLEALAAIVAALVVVWLALFVMNLLSRGVLIRATADSDAGSPVTFEAAWAAGLRAFLGMLALALLAVIAFLVVTAVCAIPVVLPLAAGAPGIAIAVVIGAVLIVPYLASLFALAFLITFAERALVLDGSSITESLKTGWTMTREHFWAALAAWLVTLLVSIAYGIGMLVVLLIVAVPFIVIWAASHTAGLLLGVPVGVAVVVVATGAFGTYQYGFWTLIYRALRGHPAPVAARPVDDAADRSSEDLLAGSI